MYQVRRNRQSFTVFGLFNIACKNVGYKLDNMNYMMKNGREVDAKCSGFSVLVRCLLNLYERHRRS
jgi:hypothetical protein